MKISFILSQENIVVSSTKFRKHATKYKENQRYVFTKGIYTVVQSTLITIYPKFTFKSI